MHGPHIVAYAVPSRGQRMCLVPNVWCVLAKLDCVPRQLHSYCQLEVIIELIVCIVIIIFTLFIKQILSFGKKYTNIYSSATLLSYCNYKNTDFQI